jgi:hypothetical protein
VPRLLLLLLLPANAARIPAAVAAFTKASA